MTEQAVEAPTTPVDDGAAPPQTEELPLWTGTDVPTKEHLENSLPIGAQEAPQRKREDQPTSDDRVDIFEAFKPVEEAWAEIVPEEVATTDELRTALEGELRAFQQRLEHRWERVVPSQQPSESPLTRPSTSEHPASHDARRDAEAVNAALRQVDAHGSTLQDFPEWQELQTVRGAARNLWNVFKEKAGDYFERLWEDSRVQGFFRTVSIRACEKIAGWAQAAIDRLQGKDQTGDDLPTAEALLKLSDAAIAYSNPRRDRPPSAGQVNVPELKKMGEALQKPMRWQAPGVSTTAAKSRSTTTRNASKRTAAPSGEQPTHLRRGNPEAQRGHKPNQR